jgi:hypothetical protein
VCVFLVRSTGRSHWACHQLEESCMVPEVWYRGLHIRCLCYRTGPFPCVTASAPLWLSNTSLAVGVFNAASVTAVQWLWLASKNAILSSVCSASVNVPPASSLVSPLHGVSLPGWFLFSWQQLSLWLELPAFVVTVYCWLALVVHIHWVYSNHARGVAYSPNILPSISTTSNLPNTISNLYH